MKRIIECLFLLMVLFYVGEENSQVISGIQGEAKLNKWKIETEVRSYFGDLNFSNGFHPEKVLYKVGVGYDWIEFRHDCLHSLDKDLGKLSIKNYIQFRL